MFYIKYKKKEEIKNVACVWDVTIKDYINQLTIRSEKQQIGIENK